MKSFTVKEISKILNTNPETVRRWIREGKLEAEQVTRKAGNTVTEEALKAFLKETPKYARIAASVTSIVSPSIGIPLAIGTLVSSALLELYGKKKYLRCAFNQRSSKRK